MANESKSRKDDGRHTPSSLADVLEQHYFPMSGGAQLHLSEYEWRMVVDALRAVRSERPFMEALGIVLRAQGFNDRDVATIRADLTAELSLPAERDSKP